MTAFQITALLITLTALFSYLNFRWFRLPPTIGVMFIALLVSLLTGMVSGFLPAWRAARMDPVDALRSE